MSGLLLSDAERQRFVKWLDWQIYTADVSVEQIQKLNVPEALLQKYRAEAMACQVVRKLLTDGRVGHEGVTNG